MFKPNVQQFSTPIRIMHRDPVNINGADKINYIPENEINFCNWKGMGGTESTESGVLVVHDTALLTMWFSPAISEQDMILLNDDEKLAYEVINIEDVEQRNMWLLVKVKRVVTQ